MIKMSEAAINVSSSSEDDDNYSCNPQAAFKEGEPSEGELDELALRIAAKWQRVGRGLGICQNVLDDIATNDATEKPYRMLLHWINTTTSKALYEDLYHVLCKHRVGLNSLAKEFCLVSAEGPSSAKRTRFEGPADPVPEGAVTGEVSGAAASTCDSGHSTGVRSARKWKRVERDVVDDGDDDDSDDDDNEDDDEDGEEDDD